MQASITRKAWKHQTNPPQQTGWKPQMVSDEPPEEEGPPTLHSEKPGEAVQPEHPEPTLDHTFQQLVADFDLIPESLEQNMDPNDLGLTVLTSEAS